MDRFEISDQRKLYQIALYVAERNELLLLQNIKKFRITDEKLLVRLALPIIVFLPGYQVQKEFGFSSEIETLLTRVATLQSTGAKPSPEQAEGTNP